MNNEPTRTRTLAEEIIAENALGSGLGRRRRNPPDAAKNPSPPAAGPPPLRRWSVAELIARAFAAPPADGMSRC